MRTIDSIKLAELREAADITEIQQVIANVISYRDKMNVMAIWTKLFACDHPEVSIEIGEAGGYVGPGHVEAFFRHWDDFFHRPDGKRGWMDFQDLANPHVVVNAEGTRARGMWNFFSPQAKEAMPCGTDERVLTALWVAGKLDCEFIKKEGVWKILKLHQLFYLRTPYDLGWLKQPDCMRIDPFFDIMPDLPPTYYTYHPDAVYGGMETMYNWGPFMPDAVE